MSGLYTTMILAQEATLDRTAETIEWIGLALVFLVAISVIGKKVATKIDRGWLPRLILWGFVAKMAASLARYYMVAVYYGSGDSYSYHEKGTIFADTWRALVVPVSTSGGEGTAFTEVTTGFLYAFFKPSMIGGFLIFAFVAYLGQILFYLAIRPWLPTERLKLYARLVLLLPSLLFWPASVGKDALMMLFIGVAVLGASRFLRTYRFSSVLIIAPGLYLASEIRPHVAGLVAIALVLAALFARAPSEHRSNPKRAVMVAVAMLGVAFTLTTFSDDFGVTVEGSTESQTPEEFLSEVSDRTEQGGSAVDGEGGAIATPAQLPGAVIKVLYRPLLHEGANPQVILSALEGTALLLITVWKLPTIWRNRSQLRQNPMYLMCFFYMGGFILAFSAINNLGILARQRVQVLPMFLALLVGLSWDGYQKRKRNGKVRDGEAVPADSSSRHQSEGRLPPGVPTAGSTTRSRPLEPQYGTREETR